MRIAISGAHRTGKTTLIEELGRLLPDHVAVDEPYHQLEEEGHQFPAMPSVEDFERQLERSIECILAGDDNRLFDRCPADILAYLLSGEEADGFDVDSWLPRVRPAMERLDVIVFVPIEDPDRVAGPQEGEEEEELRRRVDEEIREIVLGDRWAFAVETLEVTGSPRERARKVLAHLASRNEVQI